MLQITLGGMNFEEVRQQAVYCKELGPVSVESSASYEELIKERINIFPARKIHAVLNVKEYFLADARGSKLPDAIKGRNWILSD